MSLLEGDFDNLLLEAIDEGLSSLGESSKQAIYFYLEKIFKIKKEDIPYKIETFAGAIETIFGPGANFLEIQIMKRLYEKVGVAFKWHGSKNLTFTEYVTAVKRSHLKRRRTLTDRRTMQCKRRKRKIRSSF
jgi:hypothetical protein